MDFIAKNVGFFGLLGLESRFYGGFWHLIRLPAALGALRDAFHARALTCQGTAFKSAALPKKGA